jgi:lipooligosaccharide transport system ATP-binding protein
MPPQSSAHLRAAGLRKRYGELEVVAGIDLELRAGECFGLLGPNGAGKTTTLRLCLGLIEPDGGTIEVLGLPVPQRAREARRRIGVVPQADNLDPDFTVEENLLVYGRYFGLTDAVIRGRIPALLDFAELSARAGTRIQTLSGGMRRRLTLARALINDPDLIFLDEPTTGLDPAATEDVLQALVGHAADHGTTVFFSSHQLADVEQIADHVAIIDRGRIAVAGVLDDLRQNYRRIQLVFDGEAPDYTFQTKGVERVRRSGRVMTVLSSAGIDGVLGEARVLNPLSTDSAPVTLKDIFLDAVAVED